MKLDFVVAGAAKSGTTTLNRLLMQHPDILLPRIKETNFFSYEKEFEKGMQYYNSFFIGVSTDKCIGEVCPSYMYYTNVPERLFNEFGSELKIIFILRDPVDRAFSNFLMHKRRGYQKFDFEYAIKKEEKRIEEGAETSYKDYIRIGFYASQIKKFESYFKNIKIIFFEDFINNQNKIANDIFSFLGVEKIQISETHSNNSGEIRSKIVRDFIFGRSRIRKALGFFIRSRYLKSKIIHFIERLNISSKKNGKISPETRRYLIDKYFINEIIEIERITGKSLEKWKK